MELATADEIRLRISEPELHPEDRAFMKQGIMKMFEDHLAFDFTEILTLLDSEASRSSVRVCTELAAGLPKIWRTACSCNKCS